MPAILNDAWAWQVPSPCTTPAATRVPVRASGVGESTVSVAESIGSLQVRDRGQHERGVGLGRADGLVGRRGHGVPEDLLLGRWRDGGHGAPPYPIFSALMIDALGSPDEVLASICSPTPPPQAFAWNVSVVVPLSTSTNESTWHA